MKNKALLITIISFVGIIILLSLLFVTDFNLLASVPILITLFSSFTLGLCNCMIGGFEKSAKWFAICSIPTFLFTAIAVFNPELYATSWNLVFFLHIVLIAWTFIQISPASIPILQVITRISILLTAFLFGIIILGNVSTTIVLMLVKIGLMLSSGLLIVQSILNLRTEKA